MPLKCLARPRLSLNKTPMENNTTKESLYGNAPWYYRSGPLAAVLLVTALTLIIYLPALKAPFVLDDEVNIVRNMRLHGFSGFWPPAGTRYLAYLSFALNYHVGGLHVRGYHLVNMLLHILSGLTLYGLVRSIFQTPAMRGGLNDGIDAGSHIALITALIFTVHLLNTQAVIYVTQRFAVMASLFYLLSLYLYIKWRIKGKGGLSIIFYVLSIIAAVAAAKSKEISFTLPFVILMAEYVFFTEPGAWISRKRLYALIPYALVLIIIPLAIFGPELGLWGTGAVVDEGFTRVQQIVDLKELSSYTYLLTQFTVIPKYIGLFLLPLSQNLDYDYPLYHSFFNVKVIAGFLFLLLFFTSAFLAANFAKKTKKPLLLMASTGILWFFITLSIESTIIPIQDVIFEHRMYLPGAGLGLALATLIVYLAMGRGKKPSGRALLALVLIILIPLTALALRRALLWRDGIALYEDIVRKSPEKARAHNNLGTMYLQKGKLQKAMVEFRKTIALKPSFVVPYENVAKIYILQGRFLEAAEQYKKISNKAPERAIFYFNIGLALEKGGFIKEALYYYRKFVELAPAKLREKRAEVMGHIRELSGGKRQRRRMPSVEDFNG